MHWLARRTSLMVRSLFLCFIDIDHRNQKVQWEPPFKRPAARDLPEGWEELELKDGRVVYLEYVLRPELRAA